QTASAAAERRMSEVCVMQASKWDFDNTTDDDAGNGLSPGSEEALTDRFGIRAALTGLCIASLIAAIWFVRSPSFEECSALKNVTYGCACYETFRQELFKRLAKGAGIPKQ